jgi:hypothetical protein
MLGHWGFKSLCKGISKMSQKVVNWAEKNWTSIVGAVLTVINPALGVIWDAAVGYYYGGLKGLAIGAASGMVANLVVGDIGGALGLPEQGLGGLARCAINGYANGAAAGAVSAKLSGQNVWGGGRAGGLSGGIFSAGLDVYQDHANIANDMSKYYKEAHEAISEWWHSSNTSNALGGTVIGLNSGKSAFDAGKGNSSDPAEISVPNGSNGVIIQKIDAQYDVDEYPNGNVEKSDDPRINGNTHYTYYEVWDVRNGVVGITTSDGVFHPANIDTINTPSWPNLVSRGIVNVTATMIFVDSNNGGVVTNEYQTSANSFSGDLPYSNTAPKAWNPTGGVVRTLNLVWNPGKEVGDGSWTKTFSTK